MANVPNETTGDVLRALLEERGYSLNPRVKGGDPGVDILATKGDETIHIEVIGLKANLSNRGGAFYKAFFQALTHIGRGATKAAIAMPIEFESGIRKRAADRGSAWTRVGDAFRELEIWLVDTTARQYSVKTWNDLL